jgi:group II intron reverse transcriptase/maturase
MRNAATTLAIIHERGKQGLPLEDIYRRLYNPDLYLRAYDNLRNNKGAMTPGVTGETVDGMSLDKIEAIIEDLRYERFRWSPARRVYIPKKNGKMRPLGMPTWRDKLLQEGMRSMLEAYYEPQFSCHSHGFRPNRGCHTALTTIQQHWTGTRWFIEGDIKGCFDNIDHEILLSILAEKLHDNRFLRLMANMLKAGYLEEWTYNATHSGTPQGGVISPILSNIYLDRLDQFVETTLLPAYNRGRRRQQDPLYHRIQVRRQRARKRGDQEQEQELTKLLRTLPSEDPNDPDYRRLRYVRYADDFLLGFCGPHNEAEEIRDALRTFLHDSLKLDMSMEKTLITHAATQTARFLGYEVKNQQANDKITDERRSINGRLALRVPQDVIDAKCRQYMEKDKPERRPYLIRHSDYTILARYQSEYRGVVQYYILATNVAHLNKLRYTAETSLLKTLANKHKANVTAMARKYRAITDTEHGPMKCLQVTVNRDKEEKPPLVARFGGIPLRRKPRAPINDRPYQVWCKESDLEARLLADECELCGYKGRCQVHHIRALAVLYKRGRHEKPEWMQRMIAIRRKTLVVCLTCHQAITAQQAQERAKHRRLVRRKDTGTDRHMETVTGEPYDAKVSRTVRRGADGKGP